MSGRAPCVIPDGPCCRELASVLEAGGALHGAGGKSLVGDLLPLSLETTLLVREFSVLSGDVSCLGLLVGAGNSAFVPWIACSGCRCVAEAMGGGFSLMGKASLQQAEMWSWDSGKQAFLPSPEL